MANNSVFIQIVRFIILVLLQVLVLNHINFLGYINPFLYPLFILAFPLTGNKNLLIFLAFVIGLTIDMFGDSGGVHAAACLFIAWVRPVVLKYSFGVSYELNTLKISAAPITKQVVYVVSMVFLHHLLLFSMEIFNTNQILLILKSTLFSGIFSVILMVCSILLFSKKS